MDYNSLSERIRKQADGSDRENRSEAPGQQQANAQKKERVIMNFPNKETVDNLTSTYPVGCRIALDYMDDPYVHIPVGTQATVTVWTMLET